MNRYYRNLYLKDILTQIAEEAFPADTDGWPVIHSTLLKKPTSTRVFQPKHVLVTAILALVMVSSVIVFVPSARAAIDRILNRFGLSFVDTSRMQSTSGSPEEENTHLPPISTSLNEAIQQLPPYARFPTWYPEGWHLVKVEQLDMEDGKNLTYLYATENKSVMLVHICSGKCLTYLLPKGQERDVRINGEEAIYVHGGWSDSGDPNITLGDLLWNPATQDSYLSWEEDGLTYLLIVFGYDLSQAKMIKIAESFN